MECGQNTSTHINCLIFTIIPLFITKKEMTTQTNFVI